MRNPKVIDPPGFDCEAAWRGCQEEVDRCGGMAHEDGSPNWRAAFSADPGCCSCPACNEYYWSWGRIVECLGCGFQFPTDWWPMYSWGVQHARREKNPPPAWEDARIRESSRRRHEESMKHPYYRYGYENPCAGDIFSAAHLIDWKAVLS